MSVAAILDPFRCVTHRTISESARSALRCWLSIAAFIFTTAACRGPSGPQPVELAMDTPTRVHGCTVLVAAANADQIVMEFSCSAPQSALRDEAWWGAGARPGSFSMEPGDCVRFRSRYYCLVGTVPPILQPSYEASGDEGSMLLRKLKDE